MSDCFPFQQSAIHLLRSAAPDDFPASLPIYLVPASKLPAGFPQPSEYLAYTGDQLDVMLRPHLRRIGQRWHGRGFAAVVHDELLTELMGENPTNRFLWGCNLLLHEAAHYIERLTHPLRRDVPEVLQLTERFHSMEANLAAYYIGTSPLQHWHQHGAGFIRTALHLWDRFHRLAWTNLDTLCVAGVMYGLSAPDRYLQSLEGELQRRHEEPLRSVLLDDPPEPFLQLWNEDTAGCHCCRPLHSSVGSPQPPSPENPPQPETPQPDASARWTVCKFNRR